MLAKVILSCKNVVCYCIFQTERMLYIVTEVVVPLATYLENNDPQVASNQLAVSWGLHQISVRAIFCF
jgi:hypothetical protein